MENAEWEFFLTSHVKPLKILDQEKDMSLNLAQRVKGGVRRWDGCGNGSGKKWRWEGSGVNVRERQEMETTGLNGQLTGGWKVGARRPEDAEVSSWVP